MYQKKLTINYSAVLTTGITAFLLSMLWYSPLLFGTIWEKYRNAPDPSIPKWTIAFAPVREIIAALAIEFLIISMALSNWRWTSGLMFLLWVAFHAVGMAGAIIWDNMQWQLGLVHAGDWLMKMQYMGIVLTIWLNKNRNNEPDEFRVNI